MAISTFPEIHNLPPLQGMAEAIQVGLIAKEFQTLTNRNASECEMALWRQSVRERFGNRVAGRLLIKASQKLIAKSTGR